MSGGEYPASKIVPSERGRLGLTLVQLLWMFAIAVAGFVIFGIYSLFAAFGGCGSDSFGPIGYARGGPLDSLPAAATLIGGLWLGTSAVAWILRRRRGRLFLGFVTLSILGLIALREITPAIWGEGVCPGALPRHNPGQVGEPLAGHTDFVWTVAFSPGGDRLASFSEDGTVRLWDVRSHQEIGAPLWRYSGRIYAGAFSPDGRTIASGACDGTVRLWDVRTRRQLGNPLIADDDGACVTGVAFSPNGRILATASEDAYARLWDVRSHQELSVGLPGASDTSGFNDIAFSPDGRVVAAAANVGGDGSLLLWDVRSHRQLIGIRHQLRPIQALAFSPNGNLLAFGDDAGDTHAWQYGRGRGTIRLWDVRNHRLLPSVFRGSDIVDSIAFSPNGVILVACFDDGTVRLWNVHSRRELDHPLQLEAASLAFSPDGRVLAAGESDGPIRLWNTSALTATQPSR
jgi:WD40 repeat protein